jgi:hypothetical protein
MVVFVDFLYFFIHKASKIVKFKIRDQRSVTYRAFHRHSFRCIQVQLAIAVCKCGRAAVPRPYLFVYFV